MKLIALLTIIAALDAAKLGRGYLPPNHAQSSGGSEFLEAPVSRPIIVGDLPVSQKAIVNNLNADREQSVNEFVQFRNQAHIAGQSDSEHRVNYQVRYVERPERPQAALERHAAILRQDYQNNGESYAYAYETENGIFGEEKGVAVDGVKAHGGFSYTGDDGKQYSIRYTADENGFRPEGDHLPTPPPIPAEILQSLEQNARDEAAGIYDDGSYDQRKYGEVDSQKHYISSSNVINSNIAKQANYVLVNEEQAVSDEDSVVTHSASAISQGFRNIGESAQNLDHVLSNAHQEVSIGVTNAYLPPIARKVVEDRSSQNGQFGIRNRKPSFSAKSGYQY